MCARLPLLGSPSPNFTSIAIFPSASGGFGTSDGILTLGTEVPFFATGFYSDNSTQDLTTTVTWASSDTSVATIGTNTGLAIGVRRGHDPDYGRTERSDERGDSGDGGSRHA